MFSLVAVTGGQPGPGRPGGVTVTQHPGCPGPVPRAGSDSATRRRSRSRHRAARRACKCPAPTPGPRATAPGRPRRRPGDPQGRARRHSKFSETRPCWPGRSGRALTRRPAARRAESDSASSESLPDPGRATVSLLPVSPSRTELQRLSMHS